MIYMGKTIEADSAKALGIIDEVVSTEQLLDRATAVATQLAAIPPEAFALTKRQLREPFVGQRPTRAVNELWDAPSTHNRIREYLAKTIGKK